MTGRGATRVTVVKIQTMEMIFFFFRKMFIKKKIILNQKLTNISNFVCCCIKPNLDESFKFLESIFTIILFLTLFSFIIVAI